MKKLLIILLFPCFANAQCPQWIKGSKDSALNLFRVADKYLQFNLMDKYDSAQQTGRIHLVEENG